MRRLIVSMNVTLNGYMAAGDGGLSWHTDLWDEEMARAVTQQLAEADTLLLGRKTYEAMSPYWANLSGPRNDTEFTDLMLRHEKVIFSRTLTRTNGWLNCRLADKDAVKEIASLKAKAGKNLMIYGSGKLVASLARLDLIDEYMLWVHPVAITMGRILFTRLKHHPNIQLHKTRVFGNGVVLLNCKTIR